jgi:sec-independent protein translocase protein TatA
MVVLIVVLVLFGARKIPEFAKGLGQAVKEFKKASSDQEPPATPPVSK